MADVENQQGSSFSLKRKSDLYHQDQDNVAKKARKLNPSSKSADSESNYGEIKRRFVRNLNSATDEKTETGSSISLGKVSGSELENDEIVVEDDFGDEEEQDVGYDGDGEKDEYEEEEQDVGYDGDEEEDEYEDEDAYSLKAKIDGKAKGNSEDKGKGKMIKVDESDDEDDRF